MVYVNIAVFFFMLLRYGRMQTSSLESNGTEQGLGLAGEGVSDRLSYRQRLSSMTPAQGLSSYLTSNFLFTFLEDREVSDYCHELLRIFGQRYVSYVNCLVSFARPVKICQNCYIQLNNLNETYKNISSDQFAPDNTSCRDSLMRSDRLMVVYLLYDKLQDIWQSAHCDQCLKKGELSSDILYYMAKLNETLSCFESQKSNHSELCKECKADYKALSDLYSGMERNNTLCIDIEDAMNMTRKLWSNCSLPREETVPVIAVSSFMLFLPIIFYLSSFLHSEQKKRKLIHPKRAKSSNSLMNIQDKYS